MGDDRDALDEIQTLAEDIDGSILLDFAGMTGEWRERLEEIRKKLQRIIELSGERED